MGLEFDMPCKVTQDATGKWQIKTPAGTLLIPTAGIDVGEGAAKGIEADGHDLLRVIGDIVQIGNSVEWDGVRLYGCDSPRLETMATGIKFPFGSSGSLDLLFKEAYVDIAAVAENEITLTLGKSHKIIGCTLRVDQALAAGDEWDADYHDMIEGYGQNIATNELVTLNRKVSKHYDVFLNSPVAANMVNIKIRRNAGGNFTAQGRIRAIVYYCGITPMSDI